MEISYIILVHDKANHLKRLIDKLNSKKVYFYIHVDLDTNIKLFNVGFDNYNNVFFLKERNRVKCKWGHVSLVKATLNLMTKIIEDKRKGFCVLLSGSDYPIKSNAYIKNFLQKNYNINFIDINLLNHYKNLDQKGVNKSLYYHFFPSNETYDIISCKPVGWKDYNKTDLKGLMKVIRRVRFKDYKHVFKAKKLPVNYNLYGGSQWWAIPIDTVEFVMTFVKNNPWYIDFYKYSFAADEVFFQTLLFNNKDKLTFKSFSNSLTYVKWGRPATSTGPINLTSNNYYIISKAYQLFARKFSNNISENILKMIDNNLLSQKFINISCNKKRSTLQVINLFACLGGGSTLLKALLSSKKIIYDIPELETMDFLSIKDKIDTLFVINKETPPLIKQSYVYPSKMSLNNHKTIILVRNPYDVILTLLRENYYSSSTDLMRKKSLLDYWNLTYLKLINKIIDDFDTERSVLVLYEDLVTKPIEETQTILAFIKVNNYKGVNKYNLPKEYKWKDFNEGGRFISSLKVRYNISSFEDNELLEIINKNKVTQKLLTLFAYDKVLPLLCNK